MKFIIGLLTGALLGGYIMNNLTEEQRASVAKKTASTVDKVKKSNVVSTVADNVADVSGAAGQRVADVVDAAGDKVTDVIAPDEPAVS